MAVGDRCAGAGYLGMADPQCAAANYQTLVVRKGDLQQSVLATGNWMPCEVDVGARSADS